MKTAAIGVGAIAGTLAGFMAREGNDVLMIDPWKEHVDAMNEKGLTLDGIVGEYIVTVEAIHTECCQRDASFHERRYLRGESPEQYQ